MAVSVGESGRAREGRSQCRSARVVAQESADGSVGRREWSRKSRPMAVSVGERASEATAAPDARRGSLRGPAFGWSRPMAASVRESPCSSIGPSQHRSGSTHVGPAPAPRPAPGPAPRARSKPRCKVSCPPLVFRMARKNSRCFAQSQTERGASV